MIRGDGSVRALREKDSIHDILISFIDGESGKEQQQVKEGRNDGCICHARRDIHVFIIS